MKQNQSYKYNVPGAAVKSNDYEAIKQYVIETYSRLEPLRDEEDQEGTQQLFSIRVLNINYC